MMIDPELRYQTMVNTLQQNNGRLTSHRLALVRLLSVSEGHPDAMALYRKLREQFPTISLATVYKTLTLLKNEDQVLEIDLHAESHYDGNKPYPHPHLICTNCHKIIDGDEIKSLKNLSVEIKETFSFDATQYQLVIFGLCSECKPE